MGLRIGGLVVVLGASLLPCLSYAQTYSKTETIEYSDNLTSWVLGQVKRTTTNGEEVSRTDFDPTTALPTATYNFGQLQSASTYNADGTLASVKDGNNNLTSLGNYKRGIPQLIQFPATPDQPSGTSVTIVVDDLGQIRSVVDVRGAKTCYDYDAMGRMQRIQYPSEASVGQCGGSWNDTLSSFSSGYPAAYGLPAGHWRQRVTIGNLMTETLFDALWRPVVKQTYDVTNLNASISQAITRYDANGNVSYASYPQSTVNPAVTNTWADPAQTPNALGTSTLYDALNRVTSVTQDAEAEVGLVKTTMRYLTGFKTEITDPHQKVTTTSYMAFDQPTTDWPVEMDAPEGVSQIVARDAFGKPQSITQSGLYGTESDSITKTFIYDAHERLCRMMEPESGSTVTTYDNVGNVQSTASGLAISGSACGAAPDGTQTTFSYDAMNRVKNITPPSGTPSTQYLYDPAGNVQWATSYPTIWNGIYNYRNMLTGESLNVVGQNALTLGYAHDASGNLSLILYPNGESVNYAPDARGRPTQVGTYASQIGYFPNGQVAQFIYGNGTVYTAEQNARQLSRNFSYSHGTPSALALSEDLAYDVAGNITQVTDLAGGPRSKTFQYDGLNRLTSAVAPSLWGTESYTYDPLNNLRTRLSAGQTSVYNYDVTNRLLNITRAGSAINSFGYDNRGNLTNKNGVVLQFDQKNQLTQIMGLDGFAYDANGRRVQKAPASGASTYYFYDHGGQLMYQSAAGAAQTTNFIYLGTKLIARTSTLQLAAPGAVSFDANPPLGSSYTVTWGAVPAATSYTLQESANGGSWTTVSTGSGTSAALTGKAGGSYVYQVQGCIGSTCGGWTMSATLGVKPDLPVVTVPSGVVYGPYTVSWTAPISATSYTVQESFNGGAWVTIGAAITATSITRPGTTPGNYTYQVSATNAYGTRGYVAGLGTVSVLGSPNAVTFDSNPNNGVYTVSWGPVTLATSYVLQVSANGGAFTYGYPPGNFSNDATSIPFTDQDGGTYIYQARACAGSVCGAWTRSMVLGVTPKIPVITAPTNLVFGSYTVSWNTPVGTDGYLMRQSFNGGAWTTIANAVSPITPSGAVGGSYTYEVQASNTYGTRGWSAPVTVSVTQVPATPTNFVFTTDSNGNKILTWDAMTWATSYQLTVYGTNGNLGTYIYNVGDPSFNVPGGNYKVEQLAACSIAGCSATVQVSGPKFGAVSTPGSAAAAAAATIAKIKRMIGDTSSTTSGCTATICAAVIGGNP